MTNPGLVAMDPDEASTPDVHDNKFKIMKAVWNVLSRDQSILGHVDKPVYVFVTPPGEWRCKKHSLLSLITVITSGLIKSYPNGVVENVMNALDRASDRLYKIPSVERVWTTKNITGVLAVLEVALIEEAIFIKKREENRKNIIKREVAGVRPACGPGIPAPFGRIVTTTPATESSDDLDDTQQLHGVWMGETCD